MLTESLTKVSFIKRFGRVEGKWDWAGWGFKRVGLIKVGFRINNKGESGCVYKRFRISDLIIGTKSVHLQSFRDQNCNFEEYFPRAICDHFLKWEGLR